MKVKDLVCDSNFLECVDELAAQITEIKFGADTYTESSDGVIRFTEEAQDYYNYKFNEYETLINESLNVWSIQREL